MSITRYRSVVATAALAALCACGSGTAPHPDSWTPSTSGATSTWTTMSVAGLERYTYSSVPFSGGISDLASQQAIDVLTAHHGGRLLSSRPIAACPGEAGLSTYVLPGGRILEVAFAVVGSNAITVEYERPAAIREAPAALDAIQQAVCIRPA